ncbi:MAG TPA: hypothetical protein VMX94_08665 [Armatimonadota bacterium]|nr:hypothetical protein [Armatimonadota bacterium]
MKSAIVTTTIHVPHLLDGYVENLNKHGHKDVSFVIIGDLKTPPEINDYVGNANASQPYKFDYWDVDRQRGWLKRFPDLDKLIPYNSIQRRNLGTLIAAEQGNEAIIWIDDDNFVTDDDFVGLHTSLGLRQKVKAIKSSTSWFNPCDLLETQKNRRIYHRGYPHSKRWQQEKLSQVEQAGRVVVNEGLWFGAPDVDAVTHLEEPCEVTALKPAYASENAVLAWGTWAPFNSQNTGLLSELLPCAYLVVMGDELYGQKIDRYDDIWMSYFTKKCADRMGDFVRFGRPLVRQTRNPHDLVKDLAKELPGMILTEKLAVTLDEIELTSSDYLSCYEELAQSLRQHACNDKRYTYEEKAYVLRITDGMLVWTDVCRDLT